MTRIVAIDGSPAAGGRTATVLAAIASEAGGTQAVVSASTTDVGEAVAALDEADAVVIGSPIYRASFAHPLKRLLDELPRGMWGETAAPLRGKAVAIAA